MNKKHAIMLILSAQFILLSSCTGPNGDDPKNTSSGGQGEASSAQSDLTSEGSSQQGSSHESGFTSEKVSSSEVSSIDYTIGWSQEILDEMEPHLGGHAIPFIDLPPRIFCQWVEATSTYDYYSGGYVNTPAYLYIVSTGSFDAALAGAAKMTYQKAGWNVQFDVSTLTMHAVEESLGMTVDFYGEYDENDNMTNPRIDVYYTEPFIVPTSGSWRTATMDALSLIGISSTHNLPYTYLGTLAEEASMITVGGNDAVEIKGLAGGWDTYSSEIIAAARRAYPRSKKWGETTVTITSSGYYSSSYVGYCFTKNFSDGYCIKATLYGRPDSDSYYSSSEPKTPFLRVVVTHD